MPTGQYAGTLGDRVGDVALDDLHLVLGRHRTELGGEAALRVVTLAQGVDLFDQAGEEFVVDR